MSRDTITEGEFVARIEIDLAGGVIRASVINSDLPGEMDFAVENVGDLQTAFRARVAAWRAANRAADRQLTDDEVVDRAARREAEWVREFPVPANAHVIGAHPRSEPAAAAMRTLLPGAPSLHVAPRAWKSWKCPGFENALDAVVDTLVTAGKAEAGKCPFWRARVSVVQAVDAAEEGRRRYAAARDDGASKRERLRALAMSASRLEEALIEHAASFDAVWPILFEGFRDATRDGARENRLTGDALAVSGLRSRLDAAVADVALTARVARAVGEAVGNSEADAGKRAFVARMLVAFREIVGDLRGDMVVDFVDAAAEVAGLRDEGDPSWRATTRKILGEPQFTARRTPLDRD